MKMKKLLCILSILFCINAYAVTEVLYSTDRLGEGIVLQTSEPQLVIIFFSHWDDADGEHFGFKDRNTFWMIGISRNFDGTVATGNLYYDVAKPDFPLATPEDGRPDRKEISDQYMVGTFLMERDENGDWWLLMESNDTLDNKTAFNSVFHFTTPLRD